MNTANRYIEVGIFLVKLALVYCIGYLLFHHNWLFAVLATNTLLLIRIQPGPH